MFSEPTIAEEIRQGNSAAFEQAFQRYYPELCRYAQSYLADAEQAEEVVQELFVNYWNKKEQLLISGTLKSYLYSATRNSCLNEIRHEQVKARYAQHAEKEYQPYQADPVEYAELEEITARAIDQLPTERKRIFLLSRNEGLKYKEIADQLQISAKTVENQMGQALKFLREQLRAYLPTCLLVVLSFIKNVWNG